VVYFGSETDFNHINNLNSTAVLTNQAGTAVEDILFYPWGQNTWKLSGSGGYNFAGMPYYDTTTNTDLTEFRLYSPGLGRWLSPDPVAGNITNPQSLNRYAYVLNNPTTLTDPSGQRTSCPQGANAANPGQCSGNILAMFAAQMHLCYIGGLCEPSLASFMSPTGSDEFDALIPASGVYWTAPAGSAVTNSSGRTSTSTGALGFSDQIWTWANNPVDFPDLNKLLQGPPPDFTSFDTFMKWWSAYQQLSDITSGNYSYFTNYTATSQSPSPVASGLEWVPFLWLGPGVWFQQWAPLPGFGQ
jgi:RHS repeat-associated protein